MQITIQQNNKQNKYRNMIQNRGHMGPNWRRNIGKTDLMSYMMLNRGHIELYN